MTIKKTEIDKILAEDLERKLKQEGFQYVRASNWLARTQGDLTQIINWSYYTAGSGYMVSPMLGARSTAIFEIFRQVNQIQKQDEKFRRTLSTDIWRLFGDRSRGEFKVTSEAEGHAAAVAIEALVRAEALPFFERCTTVADVDRLFNEAPNSPAARLLSLDNWTRSANALIAARLAHNPKYDGLVDAYRTLLAGFSSGQFLKQYESLVSLLSGIK